MNCFIIIVSFGNRYQNASSSSTAGGGGGGDNVISGDLADVNDANDNAIA